MAMTMRIFFIEITIIEVNIFIGKITKKRSIIVNNLQSTNYQQITMKFHQNLKKFPEMGFALKKVVFLQPQISPGGGIGRHATLRGW